MEEELKDRLRTAYDLKAAERDAREISDWRRELRDNFGALLLREGKKILLELGAGTGEDGRFFHDLGFDVLCTDLSPVNVNYCWEKGLKARVLDNTAIDLPPDSYDAVYAMNSLLHLPKVDLPAVLKSIQTVLKPDGLFFMGVFGGVDSEEVWDKDLYEPKRFFSFYTDDRLKKLLSHYFSILDFTKTTIVYSGDEPYHQAITMRKMR